MPPQPGEVSLCTLFADVHYFFSHPESKPPHHRFDKRSYLYLYHDALNGRGRLEVANHAGTPGQDAIMGYLDTSTIEYSFKHPTLFTITADARGNPASPPHPQQADLSQWHLPAPDPQNRNTYMYKLHTVDVYLWTAEDASLLLDSLKRVLTEGQLRLLDAPPGVEDHRSSMSPLVQQLERVAISTPNPYQRSGSISTTHTAQSQPNTLSNMTPVSHPPQSPNLVDPQAQPGAQQPGYAAIAAYNPAAPPAPEPIAHREKTPPPPDAGSGTGLSATEHHDVVPQFGGPPLQQSFGPQAGQPFFAGPPSAVGSAPSPGHPQLQRSATSPYGGPTPPQQHSPYAPSFPGPPSQDPNTHLYAQQPQPGLIRSTTFNGYPAYPSQPGFGPQPGAIGAIPSAVAAAAAPPPQQSPSLYQMQQQQVTSAPLPSPPALGTQPPSYQQQQYAYGTHDMTKIHHSIHQMAYIPEEGKGAGLAAKAGPGQQAATGWLEAQMNKVNKVEKENSKKAAKAEAQLGKSAKFEKKVNKFFKLLDEGV